MTITIRMISTLTVALVSVGVSLVSKPAHAEDIPSNEAGAFGEHYSLLSLSGMAASGTRRGSGDVDYTRKGGQVEYRVGGFFEEDYFKTLIGLEGQFALGYQGENSYGAPPPPTSDAPGTTVALYDNAEKSAYYLRADALFTYGLVRWTRVMRGRLVLGAGGGFEAAPRFRGGEGGQGYAILLGRLQLWPSDAVGLHLTGTTTVGSYRLEALGSFDGWTFGARARWLNATRSDLTQERQLEVIAGLTF